MIMPYKCCVSFIPKAADSAAFADNVVAPQVISSKPQHWNSVNCCIQSYTQDIPEGVLLSHSRWWLQLDLGAVSPADSNTLIFPLCNLNICLCFDCICIKYWPPRAVIYCCHTFKEERRLFTIHTRVETDIYIYIIWYCPSATLHSCASKNLLELE